MPRRRRRPRFRALLSRLAGALARRARSVLSALPPRWLPEIARALALARLALDRCVFGGARGSDLGRWKIGRRLFHPLGNVRAGLENLRLSTWTNPFITATGRMKTVLHMIVARAGDVALARGDTVMVGENETVL